MIGTTNVSKFLCNMEMSILIIFQMCLETDMNIDIKQ